MPPNGNVRQKSSNDSGKNGNAIGSSGNATLASHTARSRTTSDCDHLSTRISTSKAATPAKNGNDSGNALARSQSTKLDLVSLTEPQLKRVGLA